MIDLLLVFFSYSRVFVRNFTPRVPLSIFMPLPKIKQQNIALFTSIYYSLRVFSTYTHNIVGDAINTILIFLISLHIHLQIANLIKNIKKNCWNLAPVAPMPQKVTGAKHPWLPSLRGPCDYADVFSCMCAIAQLIST